MAEISQEELSKLTEKLLREHAVDFRDYKPTSLGRRVQRRLDATSCKDMACYLALLDKRPDEYAKLVDSILINVTQFFRDPEAWEVIKSEVIPHIVAEKHPGDQIRMWSAGCATGEEAYSLAIQLAEIMGPRVSEYDIRIYATDIDDDALAIARRAEYSDDAVKDVPTEILNKYFTKNARWTLKRDIRKMVIYGRHNLVTDAPISHVDLIACRNVLIYMSVDLQNRVLSKFHYGLDPRGYLFLGKAESLLTASRLFKSVNDRWRIFRKEAGGGVATRGVTEQQVVSRAVETGSAEYQLVSMFNEAVLRYTPSGVIGVDNNNIVRIVNSAAESIWGISGPDLLGKSIFEASLPSSLQGILPRITQVRSQRTEMRIDEIDLSQERNRPLQVSVSITPMFDVMGNAFGVITAAENITGQVRLRNELEASNEQLQAANEELETTNEELQSTNEELETTNEELQSTNEELETTNEELQSTNEELETTNDELAVRTTELNTLSFYFNSIVQCLEIPIVVLNEQNLITTWNPAAERFFGLTVQEAVGRNFFEIGLPDGIAKTRGLLSKLPETRKSARSEPMKYETRTGDARVAIMEYAPLLDSSGAYKGATCFVRDAEARELEPAARER